MKIPEQVYRDIDASEETIGNFAITLFISHRSIINGYLKKVNSIARGLDFSISKKWSVKKPFGFMVKLYGMDIPRENMKILLNQLEGLS